MRAEAAAQRSRRSRLPASGLLLIDKPSGVTSHDVVARIRRIFGQREVGHTGTLDPMATGLLVLALGRATRLARFVEASEKRYVGTVTLGRATTTFDAEGERTCEAEVPALSSAVLERALAGLTGVIPQKVPAFSAVKVKGERLYARARRGEEVEAPTRLVTIHSLRAVAVRLPELDIETSVSKGTYIRSLAVQIGEALGLPAHLSRLRRTRVGEHDVVDARLLESLSGVPEELVPIERAISHLPEITLDSAGVEDVRHGRPLSVGALMARAPSSPAVRDGAFEAGAELRLVDPEGRLLGIGLAEVGSGALAGLPATERAISYACVLST